MRPVFVVGTGAITPFGEGVPSLVDAIFRGETAIRELDRLSTSTCRSRVAAELTASTVAASDHASGLALHVARWASLEALKGASTLSRSEMGLVLATTKADMSRVDTAASLHDASAFEGIGSPQDLAARLAQTLSLGGPVGAVSSACASGLSAVALAARWIAEGRVDHVLVVGVDVLNDFILRGFDSLLALDINPCRPFDSRRQGLSLGEAAGALLLSSDSRSSQGIRVAGWGGSNEAHHITRPQVNGEGLCTAAARALAMAKVAAHDIACIHLHGTGTLYNDAMEARAMATLFGGKTAPAFGTKAQLGHTLGASGIVESLISIEALRRNACPRNVGLETPDVDPHLDLTRETRELGGKSAMLKVAAGFGGIGAAVVYST